AAQAPVSDDHSRIHGARQSAHRFWNHGRCESASRPRPICFKRVDYGMNIQAALENARFTVGSKRGCNVVIESRVPEEVRARLTSMGHVLDVRGPYSSAMGRGQAVLHDTAKNVNFGGSDPRADGSAEPEPPFFRK